MSQLPESAQSKLEQFLPSENLEQPSSQQPTQQPLPQREPIKHVLIGSVQAVTRTIQHLHIIGYANVNDWSVPQPTPNSDEVMSILIRQILIR
ncbi:hypothetical protein H6G80_14755 [Nostoc sp. FACHB-87]|uniref:hypothetical protein n=1 Tax=Nostocales TaxID=1161 RepID=UPI0016847796|nr:MULTISPECIES: hypothetical protein [Nostocales]MBD2455336.1 hypothetical protein [Nostoc sp. FACHB-87]MBD2475736.1 hypothetical protein [Anabaena sp. FACHB-83]MBD2491024.1 hypothetical protein [Aulosira sp. FACHB-615]